MTALLVLLLLLTLAGWAATYRRVRQLRRLVALTEEVGRELAELYSQSRRLTGQLLQKCQQEQSELLLKKYSDGAEAGFIDGERAGVEAERRRVRELVTGLLDAAPSRGHRRAALEEVLDAVVEVEAPDAC